MLYPLKMKKKIVIQLLNKKKVSDLKIKQTLTIEDLERKIDNFQIESYKKAYYNYYLKFNQLTNN